MQSARDELRTLLRTRAALFLELLACALCAAALWPVSDPIQGATAEAQSVFLVVAFAFGVAVARLVAAAIPVLAFRCPRCDGLFHANPRRASVRLHACAHCGLSVEEPLPGQADAETR